ncbi:MAG: transpeptidase family protein [Myxococcota bacterium]|nr:transpeptidase family protein [Myxococcota bacterium]
MKNLAPARARWIQMRMGLLCGIMGLALGGVVSSAWRIQVEDGREWRETAEKQRQRRLHIEPKRGTIQDRNGTPLAVSVEVPSVSADVVEMLRGIEGKVAQDALLREAAVRLGQALSLPPAEVFARLEPRHRFVWIKRRITSDEVLAVRELSDARKSAGAIRGLSIDGEGHRYYPGRELGGAVLGFVAPDGQGKDGIELALDEELRGKAEAIRGLRDRGGRLIFDEANGEHALQGNDVVLSIDEGIQRAAERELDAAMRTYETRGASLVVVEPSTGDILAMADVPGYNPNDYTDSQADARRDRAVTDRFEPGSVMKTFTLAGALAAGTLRPTDAIDCEHGVYRVGGITVHDTHSNGILSPTQILARSSNIGALKIGLQLGESGLYAALRRFGFGEPTGVPLPGEAAGVLRPRSRSWYDAETASASFGQGISVTTLQLAMAMAAIANDGKLLEPILVKKVTDGRGASLRESVPKVRREVVPPSVAKILAEMLTAVTEEGGTAVEAAIPGFRVAGKTSTAQKVDPTTGRYSVEKYTAVFVGFVPVDHPRIVVAVVLDEPMIGRYGGDLAGPVFRRVAETSLRYLGVAPSLPSVHIGDRKRDSFPPGATAPKSPATSMEAAAMAKGDALSVPLSPGSLRVPDAVGLGAHDVVIALTKAGFVPRLDGWGRAVRQSPAPGSGAAKGTSVRVVLEPAS